MSNKPSSALAALCAVLLAGCVTPLPFKEVPPASPPASSFFVSDTQPTSAQKYSYTSLEGTYFGSSGGSGSLAVGLMFGLVGVMANVAYTHSVNRKRAVPLAALTSQDLAKILNQQLSMISDTGVRSSQAFKLTPAANVAFNTDTAYELGCAVTAELPPDAGRPAWNARYAVAVNGVFDSSHGDDTTAASNALGPCLLEAYKLFKDHVEGKIGPFELRTITMHPAGGKDVVLPVQVAVSQLPARVIIHDYLGLNEMRASEVTQAK